MHITDNKLKRPIDHTDPFAIRNLTQKLDSAKYGPGTKDAEDLLPRKQMFMPSFTRNAPYDDDEPISATPFQPYPDVVLNKPEGQFLLKQFLDGDYSHAQSPIGRSGGEREGEGECQTNTAVEVKSMSTCIMGLSIRRRYLPYHEQKNSKCSNQMNQQIEI
ncbi:hypothetical protein L1987_40000 [Smallanthus sonchifolius]|uniref:Uncharacterized protein n=1 Tax=Smallanthus sonchifolius TaxID=185202 RepID=A0ACB9GT65_9ASTR|nr:hypothetical protein L1987_40000 [Smallanthus sonchifolius]